MASQTDNSQQPFSIEDVDIERMSAETKFFVDYIRSAFDTHAFKVESYLRRLQSFNSLDDVMSLMFEGPKDYRYEAAFLRCLELATSAIDALDLIGFALNATYRKATFNRALELTKTVEEARFLYSMSQEKDDEKASVRKIAEFYRKA